ncbi:MAG TPA: hypothetical protein VJJ52_02525 [Candidatus Nanoarchaeia archaeon]|nr:hypothetical protein [Candidatus Nanoarchaeia archaeon]
MVKKRVKSKAKPASKKRSKKSAVPKKPKVNVEIKPEPDTKIQLKDALRDLEILAEEKKVENKVDDVKKEEKQLEKKEISLMTEEKKIEKEEKKVEYLEKKISKEVETKPLTRFNFKDLNKGIIGAFIGVVAHFGFIYGKAIAQYITMTRATVLFIFSYALIIMLMYETGYRDIKEKRLLGILPRRATFVYFTSIVVVIVIFYLFNMLDWTDLGGLYKEIAVTSVLASVGAGTADLIGRH